MNNYKKVRGGGGGVSRVGGLIWESIVGRGWVNLKFQLSTLNVSGFPPFMISDTNYDLLWFEVLVNG